MVKEFRNAIIRPENRDLCSRKVYFGYDPVKIQFQSYKFIYFNLLLSQCLFGVNFKKLHNREIITKTNKYILIHISSVSRMENIFTLEGLSAAFFQRSHGLVHTCCGKVNLVRGVKHMIGYILEESGYICS